MAQSSAKETDEKRQQPAFSLGLIAFGVMVLASFFGALAGWSALAPMRSAVIAPGFVSVDTYRKKIQHLEGGIIEEIFVRDGDHVTADQVLVRLRDIAPSANVARLQAQYFEALAISAQAVAELDGLTAIRFPDELVLSKSSAAKSAMEGQILVFNSAREVFQHSRSIIYKKILQIRLQCEGLEGQLAATDKQIGYIGEELSDAQNLHRKGLMPKSKMLELQRNQAQLEGKRSEIVALIAEGNQEILELELKLTGLTAARTAGAVNTLREQQSQAYEISRLLVAAEDVMRRTEIRSPIEGTVVDVRVHTRDGVIAAGQTLMEIVPSSDLLVVEARLRPEDREEVQNGLEAYVQLTSMGRRDPRPIRGTLETISADRLTDNETARPYYRVRVKLDPASVAEQQVDVLAGLGADVFIQTGERTPMQYLVEPIVRTFDRGLREN